jgi:DNA-binding GntR family transcriptional regulator
MSTPLSRETLRHKVRRRVMEEISSHRIRPGERINEVHVAARLGVSPTPLREALIGLEGQSYLSFVAGKGFAATPLTPDEVHDLYSLMALLEGQALTLAPPCEPRRILALRRANARLRRADASRASAMDEAWHALLLADCPNQILCRITASLRWPIRRYEVAYFRTARNMHRSAAQHDAVIDALARGKPGRAADLLRDNWLSGIDPILDLLKRIGGATGAAAR